MTRYILQQNTLGGGLNEGGKNDRDEEWGGASEKVQIFLL